MKLLGLFLIIAPFGVGSYFFIRAYKTDEYFRGFIKEVAAPVILMIMGVISFVFGLAIITEGL